MKFVYRDEIQLPEVDTQAAEAEFLAKTLPTEAEVPAMACGTEEPSTAPDGNQILDPDQGNSSDDDQWEYVDLIR